MSSTSNAAPSTTSTASASPSTSSSSDLNLYFYHPSSAAAIVFTAIYTLLCAWHLTINTIVARRAPNKHKYTIPLSVASLISTAGWGVRIASVKQVDSIPLYAISASYIVISPIFVCATLYLLLTRLIAASKARQSVLLGVSTRWLGRGFIVSDVCSFLTQCSGSGIASSGNWEGNLKTVGTDVLLVGLSLQLATFSVFLVVLWRFGVRARDSGGLGWPEKKVIRATWIAGVLVQVSLTLVHPFFYAPESWSS
jgi:hypothetical protein